MDGQRPAANEPAADDDAAADDDGADERLRRHGWRRLLWRRWPTFLRPRRGKRSFKSWPLKALVTRAGNANARHLLPVPHPWPCRLLVLPSGPPSDAVHAAGGGGAPSTFSCTASAINPHHACRIRPRRRERTQTWTPPRLRRGPRLSRYKSSRGWQSILCSFVFAFLIKVSLPSSVASFPAPAGSTLR